MEKRTAEIIMICKGRHTFGDDLCAKDAIKAYISDRCAIKLEHLQDRDINDIIWIAALDFMNSANKPSLFIQVAREAYDRHNNLIKPLAGKSFSPIDIYEAICTAFRLVRVKSEDGSYTNGFCEDFVAIVERRN